VERVEEPGAAASRRPEERPDRLRERPVEREPRPVGPVARAPDLRYAAQRAEPIVLGQEREIVEHEAAGERAQVRQHAGEAAAGAGRGSGVALAFLIALLALAPPLRADRRDQKAADLYSDGVALIQKGKYREGAKKMQEALDRGATEPNEQQGSESRFIVRR